MITLPVHPRRDRGMTTAEYAVGVVAILVVAAVVWPYIPGPLSRYFWEFIFRIIQWLSELLAWVQSWLF